MNKFAIVALLGSVVIATGAEQPQKEVVADSVFSIEQQIEDLKTK